MESEKQHQRSDVEFLEDLVDELFLDIGLEADRLRLAAMAKQLPVQNAHEANK
jgi:hypothetical protein